MSEINRSDEVVEFLKGIRDMTEEDWEALEEILASLSGNQGLRDRLKKVN